MQVVINVPDEEYEAIKNCTRCTNWFAFLIKKGTPLSKGHGKLVDKKKLGLTDFERADIIEKAIKLLPPVQPQPKTGHWIEQIDHEENCRTLICSNCDRPALHDGDSIWKHKFCPYCGARMIEPQERSEKINCKSTKCENCVNHNYCDYEPQESEDKE